MTHNECNTNLSVVNAERSELTGDDRQALVSSLRDLCHSQGKDDPVIVHILTIIQDAISAAKENDVAYLLDMWDAKMQRNILQRSAGGLIRAALSVDSTS